MKVEIKNESVMNDEVDENIIGGRESVAIENVLSDGSIKVTSKEKHETTDDLNSPEQALLASDVDVSRSICDIGIVSEHRYNITLGIKENEKAGDDNEDVEYNKEVEENKEINTEGLKDKSTECDEEENVFEYDLLTITNVESKRDDRNSQYTFFSWGFDEEEEAILIYNMETVEIDDYLYENIFISCECCSV